MTKEKFDLGGHFEDGGLPGMDNLEEEARVAKGGPFKTGIGKKVAKEMIGSENSKDGYKHDTEVIENVPNMGEEEKELGEDYVIDLVAAREEAAANQAEQAEKQKILDAGRAVVIKGPEADGAKKDGILDEETKRFSNVADMMAFREKRDQAMEKARQREAQKKEQANDKKGPGREMKI